MNEPFPLHTRRELIERLDLGYGCVSAFLLRWTMDHADFLERYMHVWKSNFLPMEGPGAPYTTCIGTWEGKQTSNTTRITKPFHLQHNSRQLAASAPGNPPN